MKTLDQLNSDHSTFSIGRAMSDGWNLVSKHLGYYILGGIIAIVISSMAGAIPIAGGVIDNLVLSPCLMSGAVYVTWNISKGRGWAEFGDMFKGFKFLGPVVLSSLIQGAAMLILVGLVLFNHLDELKEIYNLLQSRDVYSNQHEIESAFRQLFSNSKFLVSLLLLMVGLLVISCVWAFRLHFIVIYKMEAWPAMEMSRKIATRNLLPLIGLFLLLVILIVVSALPCGIGLLFTLPLAIGATYSAFAQITNCDDQDEVDGEMFDFIKDEKQP